MQLIDTHSHLYLEQFNADFEAVLNRCEENKVTKILLPNIDIDSVKPLQSLCAQFPDLFSPMMGLHPTSVTTNFEKDLETILSKENLKNVCAIGEIGLDYYWSVDFKAQQIEAFCMQIAQAKALNLPIAVHCRDAFDDVLNYLEKYHDENLKGVLHCFTGNLVQAQQLIEMGFYLGIGGVLTYKNAGLDKVLEKIDIKNLILETDAPYLSPIPFRGKRNESSYTIYIAKKLAEIKNLRLEEVAQITTQNAKQLFSLEM